MEIRILDVEADRTEADLACVILRDGEQLPGSLGSAPGAEDVKTAFRRQTMLRPGGRRVLVLGGGAKDDFGPDRARSLAAIAAKAARRYGPVLAIGVPDGDPAAAAALVEGAALGAWRFNRFRRPRPEEEDDSPAVATLELLGTGPIEEVARRALVATEAENRARDLQSLPANVLHPAALAERAVELAGTHDSLTAEVMGPDELEELGMGGMLAVSRGSEAEPRLIVLRHGGSEEPDLAIVGKAVTFDTGGISLKPSAKMHEMKMDMSGGAAAIEATGAIAGLGLPLDVLCVVPAVENMPSGRATRPGDVITLLDGTTVEVNNTDAEGRLILADAISWAVRSEPRRIVDLATLTGAVVVALGSTYAALIATDDELAGQVEAAGRLTGELVWRLPLHDEYRDLMKGTIADLTNAAPKRKAGTITAAAFLERFSGDVPWAHIDIAGTAWDVGRPEVGSGPSGFGTRLLVALAESLTD